MHGRQTAQIIARKRAEKAAREAQRAVVEQPQPQLLPQLDLDLDDAWAAFQDLDGPHTLWRIHKLVERGVPWHVFNVRGPKREILHDPVIVDIVRIIRSRARKGRDRYEYKKAWFGEDAGPHQKKDLVTSHRDTIDMPTKEAILDWLVKMNARLVGGLIELVEIYEESFGTTRLLDTPSRVQALMQLDIIRERKRRAGQFQRRRQSFRFSTDYEDEGGWDNQPKRKVPHKGSRTRLRGWETPSARKKA